MRSILTVILKPRYFFLMLVVAAILVIFSAWLPNLPLVASAVSSNTFSLQQKTKLLVSLVGSLQTNFTFLSLVITFTTAILAGIQVSLLVHYVRIRAKAQQAMGASFIGVASSLLGIGCASCGSVALTSLFGIGLTATVWTMLPFRGQEFGFLGIGLLLFANALLAKKIAVPVVCKV